jgi:cytidylate kinase
LIVTVSNEYGSGALAVARRVADALHYEDVDEQLPVVVAKRLQVTPEAVVASEEASPSLGERLLNSLELATPELAAVSAAEPFDEALLRAVRDAVREYAARGNVVIVGRGASAILTGHAGILRVFLHGPRQWRVTHVMATTRVPLEVARAEVDRIDRARAAYMRQWYGVTFGDPANYDLCIDTSQLDEPHCSELIVAAVRAREASRR